jgi:protein TonB
MLKMKPGICVFFLLMMVLPGYGQTVYTGRIVDRETEDPVRNASVRLLGDTMSTTSNFLGYFQVTGDTSNFLIIEKEGYVMSRAAIPAANPFLIKLAKASKENYQMVSSEYEKGQLVDGSRVGIWQYFDQPGELALKVDYSTGELLYIQADSSAYVIKKTDQYERYQVDIAPRFVGSMNTFYSTLMREVQYPLDARRQSIVGTIHILFEIDTVGLIDKYEIINDLEHGCAEAVMVALQKLPKVWVPASIGGKRYRARFAIPVTFTIIKDNYVIRPPRKRLKNREPVPLAYMLEEIVVKAIGVTRRVDSPSHLRGF